MVNTKTNKIVLVVFSFIILVSCLNKKQVSENFKKQIGVYQFDTVRTELKGYDSMSNILNDLYVEFKSDSTFQMSFQVPFFLDSIGRWSTEDNNPYNYNHMWYKGFEDLSKGVSMHFNNLYRDRGDIIFMISATHPKFGSKGLNRVYFKKVVEQRR